MNSTNPVALLGCAMIAMASAIALSRFFPPPSERGRYASIDGLRGLLALLVYIHHGAHWYDYIHTGHWINPPSRLYANIGTGSVVLFFLVSGFLFIGKIVDRRSPIDWRKLYLHRFFRLAPLYFFVIALLLAIVFLMSGGKLLDTTDEVGRSVLIWLLFTLFGQPAINSIPTFAITSGVTWSLTFEWFFYLSLPLLALSIGRRVPLMFAIPAFAALVVVGSHLDDGRRLLAFAGAPIAVYAVQFDLMRRLSSTAAASLLVIAFVLVALLGFDGPYERVPLILLSAAFVLIACGCSVFGTLTAKWSLYLGELAYSMYLLHGIVLFVVFKMIVGTAVMARLSMDQYWLSVIALTAVVVAAATSTFRLIERPGIAMGKLGEAWLKARFAGSRTNASASA